MIFYYLPIYREEVGRVVKELKLKLFRTSVKENFNVEAGIIKLDCPLGRRDEYIISL